MGFQEERYLMTSAKCERKDYLLKGKEQKRKVQRGADITEAEEDPNIEYPSSETSKEMSYVLENLS